MTSTFPNPHLSPTPNKQLYHVVRRISSFSTTSQIRDASQQRIVFRRIEKSESTDSSTSDSKDSEENFASFCWKNTEKFILDSPLRGKPKKSQEWKWDGMEKERNYWPSPVWCCGTPGIIWELVGVWHGRECWIVVEVLYVTIFGRELITIRRVMHISFSFFSHISRCI